MSAFLCFVAVLVTACTSPVTGPDAGRNGVPPGVSSAFAGMLQLDAPEFRRQALERGFRTEHGGVILDVQTEGMTSANRNAFDRPDLQVRSFRPEYERISVVAMTPEALAAVAALPFVRQVSPAWAPSRDSGDQGY